MMTDGKIKMNWSFHVCIENVAANLGVGADIRHLPKEWHCRAEYEVGVPRAGNIS